MPLSRRQLIAAGTLTPILASCATDLSRYGGQALPDLAASLGVCAANYAVLSAGRPKATVGMSGCSSAQALSSDALFQAASLTKPLIAFVALTLVREGTLDLRAPVSRYLPDGYAHRQNPFAGPQDLRVDVVPARTLARIPVGCLLNHSAGLPNWTSGALAPEFEPGTRWQYSGEGYLLLQAVICAVTGQDIESLVAKAAFKPLDMRHSSLRLTDDMRSRAVSGTSWWGASRQFDFLQPNAAASLYTTADDYAKLMSALLADPPLLSLTVANPIATQPDLGLSWGHGWGIEAAAGGPYLWQWGNNPGFRAFAMVSITSGNGFVLLTNSERGMPLAAPLARSTVPAAHGVFHFDRLG